MNTSNTSSFFQSAEAQEKFARQSAKASNTLGSPFQYPTKILDVCRDAHDAGYLLLAESGSVARRVRTDTGATAGIYRGHSAPVTKVIDLGDTRIVTASWDKTIRVFDKSTKKCLAVLARHTDFIKCILHVPALDLLLSGSSDSHIRAWSLTTYECVYTLKGHARGVECLTLGPEGILISGGSESAIRQWDITTSRGTALGEASWLHETSLYALHYNHETESLWSASADRTARQLTIDQASHALTEETQFDHPDYVRDIVIHQDWLITACRDEHIRVFEIGSGKLIYTLQGHYMEVSALCIVGNTLISTSLDATMRRWSLTKEGLARHVAEQEAWHPEVEADKQGDGNMTAEELAELEDLMSD